MRNEARKLLIALGAANQGNDAIAKAVAECAEGESVSPRLLKVALEGARYEVKATPRKVLTRVEVFKDGAQVMYGESGTDGDALLQAALAYLRALPVPEQAAV